MLLQYAVDRVWPGFADVDAVRTLRHTQDHLLVSKHSISVLLRQCCTRVPMLEYLPDVAQAAICPLASTPSCPAHVLLARVSKLWGAAALKHFRVDGAGITLQLSCSPDSPTADKLHELKRLESMAAWLKQQGHAVTTFSIQTSSSRTQPDGYVSGRSYGVYNILEALAAAGPGGLRLQQLQVPAIGLATPSSLAMALSGCHQLRQLQLDRDCGVGSMDAGPCGYVNSDLCLALQQLTRLTALKLYAHKDGDICPVVDGLFKSLPNSLEVLDFDAFFISTCSSSSLQHLVALKRLTLPVGLIMADSSISHPLCPLTAVTYLDYFGAMVYGAEGIFLPMPNLIELWCSCGPPNYLTGKTTLRSLACEVLVTLAGAADLAQLTHLTQLKISLVTAGAALTVDHLSAWGTALSALTGMRSLALQAEVLVQVDLATLTALTRLEVFTTALQMDQESSFSQLAAQLGGLAPARGRVQEVVLLGVPAAWQEACRSAVATAVGDVSLVFRQRCGRRLWCVCCNGLS